MGSYRIIYLFIYYLSKYCRAGRVDTRPKFQNPLSKYLKYPYPYLSIYMLTDGWTDERFGRIGRAGRVSRSFAHP